VKEFTTETRNAKIAYLSQSFLTSIGGPRRSVETKGPDLTLRNETNPLVKMPQVVELADTPKKSPLNYLHTKSH